MRPAQGRTRARSARRPARARRPPGAARRRGRELRGDLARELSDVRRLGPQLERAGLQAGEVQQLGREVAHALDLAADLLEELAPGVVVELLVREQLEEAAEREDRRAQLVRGGRDELLARPVQARELGLHVVERGRELAELVVGVGADRVREVARGHLAGRALEPLHAQRQRARHEVAGEQRDHERRRAGDEDLAADQRHVGLDVGERVREHRDADDLLARHQRLGGERLPADVGVERRRHRLAGLERPSAPAG